MTTSPPEETHPKVPKPASAPESTPITTPPAAPETYEETNVHEVYEQIASHFSSTRYKAWPIVKSFLQGLAPGSIGLDVGCGNGKYLLVNPDVFIIGSDRSTNLAKIASSHQPIRQSIAVIHHLSTPARRREAVQSILATLSPSGKALIYVWALEQSSSRRGWDETNPQDVMVPWVMRTGKKVAADGSITQPASEKPFNATTICIGPANWRRISKL
ncbi:tRNA (uracil-5-)-methyltransferase trm9 [Botrytis cinerea]